MHHTSSIKITVMLINSFHQAISIADSFQIILFVSELQ